MNIEDKEIVYTYIPPKRDWIYNKQTYSFELYSLLYSVEVFKKNFKPKKISLYSTKEICGFLVDSSYFDKLVVLEKGDEYITNQNGGYNHPNMLYKMFTVEDMSQPFLHLDNDLFLNNPSTFDEVHNDVLFAYEENIIDRQLNELYYDFYFTTYNQIIRNLPETSLNSLERFNPMSAFNCCIFGGDNYELIKNSFGKSNQFFKDNYEYLNPIPNIPGFIEQYLQSSYLQEQKHFHSISFLGDLLKQPTDTPRFDEVFSMDKMDKQAYKNIDQSLVRDIMNYLRSPINVHLSFIRWYPPYMVAIYNLLKQINPQIINKIETIYGKHAWCINVDDVKKKID